MRVMDLFEFGGVVMTGFVYGLLEVDGFGNLLLLMTVLCTVTSFLDIVTCFFGDACCQLLIVLSTCISLCPYFPDSRSFFGQLRRKE